MEILLVRHGESAANMNRIIHKEMADHAIPLTDNGHSQAVFAANKVYNYLQRYDDRITGKARPNIALWVSPYLRTRQTAEPFTKLKWLNGDLLFSSIKEDVALVEQQFGLFDGLSDEELQEKYPNEYEHYSKCEKFNGRFWARMPLGESRLDVTLRVHQLFGTWQRDAEKHNIHKLVVVSHGVTIRAIVMRWLHHSVEWFEAEKNPTNCSIRIIKDCTDYGYL